MRYGERRPGLARVVAATTILSAMIGLAIMSALHPHAQPPGREDASLLTGLAFLGAALFGLLSGRWWGRWLGLSIGVVCTLFGAFGLAAVAGGKFSHVTDIVASVAMGMTGPVLLFCLSGRAMFERYDAPAGYARGVRPSLVRWAVVTNLSSFITLALLSFAVFDERARDRAHWEFGLLAAALVLGGVVMLARGKTIGLLFALVTAPAEVVLTASMEPGASRLVFGTLLLPGFALVVALAIAYSGPIWRFVRAR